MKEQIIKVEPYWNVNIIIKNLVANKKIIKVEPYRNVNLAAFSCLEQYTSLKQNHIGM